MAEGQPTNLTEATNAAEYVQALIDNAARRRLPDLFSSPHPDAIYHVPDRSGVSIIVLPTTALRDEQLVDLMKYRLAQYLAVGFVDPEMIYEARMEHEPRAGILPNDIHVIAGSVETGEVLCYATLESPPDAPPGTTLRDRERPPFPVERVHGWGVYNRLRILPDLPISKLRELGRFVKNQRLHTFDELGARSVVEVGIALFRCLTGPLRLETDAIIGDREEGVAKQNLDFFHVPMIVIHGTVPYQEEASYFFPRYQDCVVYPFAALATDISHLMIARLAAIEEALEQPGKRGLLALFALKRETSEPTSTLEPPEGLAALVDAPVPEQGGRMVERRVILDLADRLRQTDLLGDLSVPEAAVLGTFMQRVSFEPGDVIVRQGDLSDSLYLIEAGGATVQVRNAGGDVISVAQLEPGDYFGEIALLTGDPRNADVVADEPTTVLQLTREAFTQYLSHAADIETQLTRTALRRSRDTARKTQEPNP